MMRKKISIGRGLLGLCAAWVGAQAEEVPFLRTDIVYSSSEVVRGVKHTGAAAKVGAVFSGEHARGLIEGLQPLASGQERRLTVGAAYVWPRWAGVEIEAAVRQSWFSPALASAVRQTLEGELAATLPAWSGFVPRVSYARDFRRKADFVEVGCARSVALTSLGTFLDCAVFSGWATGKDWRPELAGGARSDSYHYWGAEAVVPYRIGLHTTLITGLHYTEEQGRSALNGPPGRGIGQNCWITFGVSLDF